MNSRFKIVLSYLLISGMIFLLVGCIASVREDVFPERVKSAEVERSPEDKTLPPQLGSVVDTDDVAKDTVVIDYTPRSVESGPRMSTPQGQAGELLDEPIGTGGDPLELEFARSLEMFDRNDIDEACSSFELLSGTLPARDSLRYEALFMLAECAAVRDQLVTSVRLLESMYADDSVPNAVREKVMVRLGQMYCILGDESRAEQLFGLFRVQYPNSIYARLADCDSVR